VSDGQPFAPELERIEQPLEIERDEHDRLVIHVGEDLSIGLKMLSESDLERTERGTHAYGVVDLATELGPIRIRNVRVFWNARLNKYQVRWYQWRTGKLRNGRSEYLDVAGPQDQETRKKFAELILQLFNQIREGVGIPGRGTLGRNPGLIQLRQRLTQEAEKPAVQQLRSQLECAQNLDLGPEPEKALEPAE